MNSLKPNLNADAANNPTMTPEAPRKLGQKPSIQPHPHPRPKAAIRPKSGPKYGMTLRTKEMITPYKNKNRPDTNSSRNLLESLELEEGRAFIAFMHLQWKTEVIRN